MKTAEEILSEFFYNYALTSHERASCIKAINEARIEVIKECAESAKVIVTAGNGYAYVDKQSILSLINEVK